jgi:CheY-like chemotaxis protein
VQLKLESFDAHPAISNVAEMCSSEIGAKNLNLVLDLEAADHHVSADAPKFQQVILNLLQNAIKFTGENGRITISTSNPTPHNLEVAVTDTGIGIEPEIMERIFNRFEQGDRSFQGRFGGLGLGLTISRSFAEAHGGTLFAQSDGSGHGARFLFTIKTVPAPAEPSPVPAVPADGVRPLRILLVDDHVDTTAALKKLLTRRGHTVAAAANIRSAIEVAEGAQFDLLISDVGLPDGSGLELMTLLGARFGMPGIAISGFGMNGDVERSIKAGFSEHLVKPVQLEKLEAAMAHAISREG